MKAAISLIGALCLVACTNDETITAYAPVGQSFWLQSIDGVPFASQSSIRFDEGGTISGVGPCNSYAAGVTVPYPWFELGPIRATRTACPELSDESAFFAALGEMTLAESNGPVLILSNDTGGEMVFELKNGATAQAHP